MRAIIVMGWFHTRMLGFQRARQTAARQSHLARSTPVVRRKREQTLRVPSIAQSVRSPEIAMINGWNYDPAIMLVA
jgi:hypothetical protein